MKKFNVIRILAGLFLCLTGVVSYSCSDDDAVEDDFIGNTLPPVYIYKTNGNFYNNVPVVVAGDTICFPVSDSAVFNPPVSLCDGYFIEGLVAVTGFERFTFTKWTYEDLEGFDTVPDREKILANVIPGSKITEVWVLFPGIIRGADMTINEYCNDIIRKGFPGCMLIYKADESE